MACCHTAGGVVVVVASNAFLCADVVWWECNGESSGRQEETRGGVGMVAAPVKHGLWRSWSIAMDGGKPREGETEENDDNPVPGEDNQREGVMPRSTAVLVGYPTGWTVDVPGASGSRREKEEDIPSMTPSAVVGGAEGEKGTTSRSSRSCRGERKSIHGTVLGSRVSAVIGRVFLSLLARATGDVGAGGMALLNDQEVDDDDDGTSTPVGRGGTTQDGRGG